MDSDMEFEGGNSSKKSWSSYDTVFLNSKAGMDGVDKKKVQKVVYDMSKGSRYFDNEQRKQAAVEQRVQSMNCQAASLTPAQLALHEKEADLKIAELEASRDLSRIWLHVDMDAFYAAVETLEDPSLAGKPMAVGGMSMICTANYEARKFGVRAAMPGFIARKLCPDLVFVRPDFEKYTRYSELSRQVFRTYDPNFVAGSLDEAYLDITNSCSSSNLSAAEVAAELRDGVHKATGLTCSAGVGPNRLLAKVCSDIKKPNGQYVLDNNREAVMAFISTQPIRKVSGIGKVTEGLLKEVLGVSICADLLTKRAYISALFSRISTDFFLAVALGVGGSEPPKDEPRKSLSNERTFAAISREADLLSKLDELAHALAEDLQKEDLRGRTLTLKLKTTGFEVRTRAVTLPSFIHLKDDILLHASKLLKGELPITVRLMGLRMSHFKGEKVEPVDRTQRTLTSFLPPPVPAPESSSGCDGGGVGEHETGGELRAGPPAGGATTEPELLNSGSTPGQQVRKPDWRGDASPSRGTGCVGDDGGVCSDSWCDPGGGGGMDAPAAAAYTPPAHGRVEQQPPGAAEASQASTVVAGEIETKRRCLSVAPEDAAAARVVGSAEEESAAGGPSRSESRPASWGRCVQEEVVWVEDRCSVCGAQVEEWVPCGRQEHEDYHLALWLQEEEGSGAPSSSRGSIKPKDREASSNHKRKSSSGGGKRQQHTPTKKGGHVPIDAFFSKVSSGRPPTK